MDTVAKRLYEGMFLIDTALAASDWEGVIDSITKLLEKNEARIVSIKKWDERRLAYDVNGKSRGTYILTYFDVDGEKVADIERDARLSERIMRLLVLRADKVTREDIERDTPALAAEKAEQERREQEDALIRQRQQEAREKAAAQSSETAPTETGQSAATGETDEKSSEDSPENPSS